MTIIKKMFLLLVTVTSTISLYASNYAHTKSNVGFTPQEKALLAKLKTKLPDLFPKNNVIKQAQTSVNIILTDSFFDEQSSLNSGHTTPQTISSASTNTIYTYVYSPDYAKKSTIQKFNRIIKKPALKSSRKNLVGLSQLDPDVVKITRLQKELALAKQQQTDAQTQLTTTKTSLKKQRHDFLTASCTLGFLALALLQNK